MPEVTKQQLVFAGVDAQSASHLLSEDRVQTATNIDFSLQRGAATVRRGSTILLNYSGNENISRLYRHYNNPFDLSSSPVYHAFPDLGVVMRTVNWGGSPTFFGTYLSTSPIAFGSYKRYAYITIGTERYKDDGTNYSEWIKPAPTTPTVTINTLTPLTVCNTWTVAEGTLAGGTSTATGTVDENTFRLTFTGVPTSTNLNLSGTHTIDDWGVDYLDILFSNPGLITRVSRDYSIGDTSFNSYFHTEYDIELSDFPDDVLADAETLFDSQISGGTSTNTVLTSEERALVLNDIRTFVRSPKTRISAAANTFNAWGVSRPNFELVGKVQPSAGASLWANIGAVRVVVEATRVCEVQIRDWQVKGAKTYPLNDAQVGYAWWQTFAKIQNGFVVSESAPSPMTARFKTQHANATIVCSTTTGNDITHAIYYRQGGYLQSPYAVGTSSISAGGGSFTVATFTDSLTDVEVLSQGPSKKMQGNLYSKADFPNNVSAIAEPFYTSLFFSSENKLYWSKPNRPDSFPIDNNLEISHAGDEIQSLITYPSSMVIVNRDTVYELTGNVFDGAASNYLLQKSSSIRGSKARGTIVKTPFGIPLLDYDGVYFYQPSQGVDISYPWIEAKLGDAFKGAGAGNPATLKGGRIPAINKSFIINSQAAFYDNKLYLACPTGSDERAKTMFVIDFNLQDVWWYVYPFEIHSLFWDFVDNRLAAGTGDSCVVQLEASNDADSYSVNQVVTPGNIVYTIKTGVWTTKKDIRLENLSLEYQGSNCSATATLDGTTSMALGTMTSTTRDWLTKSLVGTIANNITFAVVGTKTSTGVNALYSVEWDSLPEPKRVNFYRTEHDINNYDGEKLWDIHYADVELVTEGTSTATTTVLGTVFVDEVAVMTHTITGPSGGRKIFAKAFPTNTFGNVAYTIFTRSGTNTTEFFKLWKNSFGARNEPPRITSWKTDVQSMEENICDAVDVDIAPYGTVTSTVFVDNIAVGTFTNTGTLQQSFTNALPVETYGRTIYAVHSGAGFKHYRTWFHLRQEPDRWTSFVTDKDIGDESIWDAVNYDINPLGGTALGTVYVGGTVVTTATVTGSVRTGGVLALPAETYGRSGWVEWNSTLPTTRFKHYQTWFDKRPEPDRVTSFVTDRESGNERWLDTWEVDINPLGGTTTATVFADNTAVWTFTMTGSSRHSQIGSIPADVYCRTVYAKYSSSSVFKHYRTWFEGRPEPDRVTVAQSEIFPYSSEQNLRTWVADLNPLGGCVGTVYADGVALTTATFTGFERKSYNVGLDVNSSIVLNTATTLRAIYTGTSFKHYSTQFETTPKPFGKTTWSVAYKKVGGASQLDIARFWSIDLEPLSGTATITSIWDMDGSPFHTNTLTFTGREFRDVISFPPGGRGKIFQHRLISSTPIHVYESDLDVLQVGIKGLVRRGYKGKPQ